jgi:hypothetical protein
MPSPGHAGSRLASIAGALSVVRIELGQQGLQVGCHRRERLAEFGDIAAVLGGFLGLAGNRGDVAAHFLGGSGDLGAHRADLVDRLGDRVERPVGGTGLLFDVVHPAASLLDAFHRRSNTLAQGLDHVADLAGRVLCLAGERADLLGNDGKAPTVFPGPRGLDGRIEREQVGLISNAANHLDDAVDPVAMGPQGFD